MKKEQRKRIVDRHRDSLKRYGYHPNALYWSSREIQELRFKVLAGIGVEPGDSLLDVGCGFGDFKGWFTKQHGALNYTGIDLSPELLVEAGKRHSGVRFFEGDLFEVSSTHKDFVGQGFDWVVLSGALNEPLHDESSYAHRMIARMFELCRKGVAFNLLDARHLKAPDLQSHQPEEVLNFCRSLSPDCTLRDDYLKNDFTIYMRKLSTTVE